MFKTYLALGDSMSIDFYAFADAGNKGLICRENIGAASLLFSNDCSVFPEFEKRDLQTLFSDIRHKNFCVDGDSCFDVLSNENLEWLSSQLLGNTLITLTLGGNDLLLSFRKSLVEGPNALTSGLEQLKIRYAEVIAKIQTLFSQATIITCSVYDPTDGTGVLPTQSPLFTGNLPIEYLKQFNKFVAKTSIKHGLLFADVHKHFAGHGALCGNKEDFWYFPPSPIEPNYRGASEIRRVWLETLGEHLVD